MEHGEVDAAVYFPYVPDHSYLQHPEPATYKVIIQTITIQSAKSPVPTEGSFYKNPSIVIQWHCCTVSLQFPVFMFRIVVFR